MKKTIIISLFVISLFGLIINKVIAAPTDIVLSNNTIFENKPSGTIVGNLSTIDSVAGTYTYSLSCITPGTNDSNFNISGTDLVSNRVFNFSRTPSYNICIRTDDGRGGTFDKNFTININVLDFETIGGYSVIAGIFNRVTTLPFQGAFSIESNNLGANNSTSCFEANRDILVDSTIDFYRKTDSEANYDFLRFYTDGAQTAQYSGNIAWGLISFNVLAGNHTFKWCYEKDQSVSVGLDKAWVDFITITEPINNIPTNITLSNQAIDSALPIGSLVGTMTTTDADVGDSHVYSFSCTIPGVDDASFNISGADLVSNKIFDNTIKSTYNICIRTDDLRDGTFDKNFTITINPPTPNNPPTNITLSNTGVFENMAIGTIVGALTSTDPDTSDTHTYSLSCTTPGIDDSRFNISGTNLVSNEVFDFDRSTALNICIKTDDGRGGTFDKNFTINVNVLDFEITGGYSVVSGIFNRVTTLPFQGAFSIESDNLGANNSTSCFETNRNIVSNSAINFYRKTDSEANYDFLRFYIDGTQTAQYSGNLAWGLVSFNVLAGNHTFKWCYEKDGSVNTGLDKAWVDLITISDITPPTILSINYSSGTLLPGGNHNIIINYYDDNSGINTNSGIITLNKWNGTVWGADISSTGFSLPTITTTVATYPTSNLSFGKYRYNFTISDNSANSSSTGAVFYIDEPELIISTGALDIGTLKNGIKTFSPLDFGITIKTLGAPFNLILNKDSGFLYQTAEITDWNGTNKGVGYDKAPYTSTIKLINPNEIIATGALNINVNGNKNTYLYNVNFGSQVGTGQAAGNYLMNIKFGLDLSY